MDYYNMQNIQADTNMRNAVSANGLPADKGDKGKK